VVAVREASGRAVGVAASSVPSSGATLASAAAEIGAGAGPAPLLAAYEITFPDESAAGWVSVATATAAIIAGYLAEASPHNEGEERALRAWLDRNYLMISEITL
jgi:hypothetical protein